MSGPPTNQQRVLGAIATLHLQGDAEVTAKEIAKCALLMEPSVVRAAAKLVAEGIVCVRAYSVSMDIYTLSDRAVTTLLREVGFSAKWRAT